MSEKKNVMTKRNLPFALQAAADREVLCKQANLLRKTLRDALKAIKERNDALRYLMEQFDGEVWNCPQCGHAEGTADTDSAIWLRDWLKTHNTEGD